MTVVLVEAAFGISETCVGSCGYIDWLTSLSLSWLNKIELAECQTQDENVLCQLFCAP